MTDEIEVSVVLPNFNGRHLFQKNLYSLVDALEGISSEIIVVDDASTDDSISYLRKHFPEIKIIVFEKNQGFSVACNAGIHGARGRYTCVANTDVIFDKNYFNEVLLAFGECDCFAVKGRVINYGVNLNDVVSIDSTVTMFEKRGFLRFDKNGKTESRLLDAVSESEFPLLGCCFIAQSYQLQALGGYDEIYTPYYWEDSDLPLRAAQRGWKIYYDDAAIVWHEGGASINANRGHWHRKLISNRNKFIFSWRFHKRDSFWPRHVFFIVESLLVRWIILDWQYYAGFFLALQRVALTRLHKWRDGVRLSKKSVSNVGSPESDIKELDIEALFRCADEVVYKDRNELRLVRAGSNQLVIKSFHVPNFINRIAYAYFRKSKAMRSFENSMQLRQLAICSPAPVGFVEFFHWGLLSQSYYASEYAQARSTMHMVLHGGQRDDKKEFLLQKFGRFVAMLHEHGVCHNDLSPGNILIKYDEKGGVEFCLVDVNRMKFGLLTDEERFANFKMLWASDEDLRIIMNAYAEVAGIDPVHAYARALFYSKKHKQRSERKEKIKRWLGLS